MNKVDRSRRVSPTSELKKKTKADLLEIARNLPKAKVTEEMTKDELILEIQAAQGRYLKRGGTLNRYEY
jgi:hypothetical protein